VCTESYNDFGIYGFNLSLKVWQTACYFFMSWVSIFGRTAFEDIANVDIGSFESHCIYYFVEELSGPSNEGSCLSVFVGSGCFTDEEYIGVWVSFAGDGVSSCLSKFAPAAFSDFIGDFFEFGGGVFLCLSGLF